MINPFHVVTDGYFCSPLSVATSGYLCLAIVQNEQGHKRAIYYENEAPIEGYENGFGASLHLLAEDYPYW